MSIEQVKAFYRHAGDDPSLQDEFRSAALESAEALSRLGHKHGYAFAPEDAMAALEHYESGELSDEDLDLVSAGGSCPPAGTSETSGP